ncbi:MAG: FG-GAP-like repeat-containing protein [Bacteroidota bacterium]
MTSKFTHLFITHFLLFFFFSLSVASLMGQNTPVSFSNQSSLLTPSPSYSGAPIGIADMNGDRKDDIVQLDNRVILKIAFQNSPNQAFTIQNYGQLNSGNEWSMCIADVDKNGINDILAGGSYNNLKLVTGNSLGQFSSAILTNSNIFLQGSNFADINNDGWIDIFACHDDADSRKYENDGTGGFSMNNSLLNTTTSPASDNSGNYASIWTDYDNDGDLDMYLSKCRLGVTDPTDPRRVNKLMNNNGSNVFTDVAVTAVLQPGTQTWTTDFADVDNDGDLDAFINNHDADCQLFLNNGSGTFTDATAGSGFLPTLSSGASLLGIQAIFRDFNNDGYVDLLYAGEEHFLFYNDGDGTFTVAANPFNLKDIHSFAIGDLNHDGFLDIYAGHGSGYNGASSTDTDELFMNNGNSNHFITIQLEGIQSNINGIGARVEAYGPWGKQIREVRSGEGYGIMNSFDQHFGLANHTVIDSIVVKWPSGTKDKIVSPAADQFLFIVEGTRLNAEFTATPTQTYPAPALIGFDASTTYNPVGGSLIYDWDFGDGNMGSGVNPNHTYSSAGTYKVLLTVTDINTDTDKDSLFVTIGNSIDDFPDLDYDDDNDGIPDSVEQKVGAFSLQTAAFQIPSNGGNSTQNVDLSAYGIEIGDLIQVSNVVADGDLNGSNEYFTLSINGGVAVSSELNTGIQCSGSNEAVNYDFSPSLAVIDIGSGVPGISILGTTGSDVDDLSTCTGVEYQLTISGALTDVDRDGIVNELDLDTDNDGNWDVAEAGGVDTNKDGFIDNLANQASLVNPPNADADLLPDFADLESSNAANDGTGTMDISATQFTFFDTNGDGQINSDDTDGGTDGDQDGLDDLIDGNLKEKGAAIIGEEICVAGYSVARKWSEVLLEGIRGDFARPTVHARNLHHISSAMYDAWSAYEHTAQQYFLGNSIHGFAIPFTGTPAVADSVAAQEEALSYAAYRLINQRFGTSPGKNHTLFLAYLLMEDLGYDPAISSTSYASGGPAELGNYIADRIIAYGQQDQSNEANDFANQYYNPVNNFIEIEESGNPNLEHPNRWQPIAFDVFIDQSGNVISSTVPDFLSPEWGNVNPFALKNQDKSTFVKDGDTYHVYHDPGTPPHLDTTALTADSDLYKWAFSMVATWSSHLDPSDGVMWDISPASIGNIDFEDLPTDFNDHDLFYDYYNGGVIGNGRTLNPKTSAPYVPQQVPRGDYARVLAEFWADGPDSETPPGHWFTLLNYVNDHPQMVKKWRGQGDQLSDLEWDIKTYFSMGGTMHDAAITAWGIKGWYDYIRPVSALRYMARRGQSTNASASNYDIAGIPLVPGLIETVELGDALAGPGNVNVGKIKLLAWKGPNYIINPETDVAGVDWILADDWWPYQRPSFVTPPFAGYVSGHSTYSRAAAELMTYMTGDEYFPGGMGEFLCKQNEFLVFEEGPSVDVTLQWATYRDASDECSLSRIWGGIHPSLDDIPGRIMGKDIGSDGFVFSDSIFNGNQPMVRLKAMLEGAYAGGGNMNTTLTDNGDLSSTDPYGLGITASTAVMNQAGDSTPVDWVKVELRHGEDSTQVLATTAAIIQKNGTIISAEGNPVLMFPATAVSSFYLLLTHYNHLSVMTEAPMNLRTEAILVDFSDPATPVYDDGGAAMKNSGGVMLLWAGDANGDGTINAVDKNTFWRVENGNPYLYGTSTADFNLDGVINAADANGFWRANNSLTEQIPD